MLFTLTHTVAGRLLIAAVMGWPILYFAVGFLWYRIVLPLAQFVAELWRQDPVITIQSLVLAPAFGIWLLYIAVRWIITGQD